MVVVAGALSFASGVTTSANVASVVDAGYNALDAAPVNCDKATATYVNELPR